MFFTTVLFFKQGQSPVLVILTH